MKHKKEHVLYETPHTEVIEMKTGSAILEGSTDPIGGEDL